MTAVSPISSNDRTTPCSPALCVPIHTIRRATRLRGGLLIAITAIIIACGICRGEADASNQLELFRDRPAQILIISSYGPSYQWSRNIIGGITETLDQSGIEYSTVTEYLYSRRAGNKSSSYYEQMTEIFLARYPQKKFDLIFACDDNALSYITQFREQLSPGTPVVFCGVNQLDLKRPANMTGVFEDARPEKTISLALELLPKTRHFYVVYDRSSTSQSLYEKAMACESTFRDQATFHPLTGLTFDQLREELGSLPKDSVVLYCLYQVDSTGESISSPEAIQLVGKHSVAPAFVFVDVMVKDGILGGAVLYGKGQGQEAASLGLRILSGTPVNDIQLAHRSPHAFVVSWPALQHFKIPVHRTPPGTVFKGRPRSFYAVYARWIWGGVVVIIVEALLIGLLLANRRRWVRSERVQVESHKELQEYTSQIETLLNAEQARLKARDVSMTEMISTLGSFQSQLIQAEKMASLGTLLTGIAHEVNSPLGAMLGAGETIRSTIHLLPSQVTTIADSLHGKYSVEFNQVIGHLLSRPDESFSSKEKRVIVQRLKEEFEQREIPYDNRLIDLVIELNLRGHVGEFAELLRSSRAVESLYAFGSIAKILRCSAIIEMAAHRAEKIILALKSYAHQGTSHHKSIVSLKDNIENVLVLYNYQMKHKIKLVTRLDESVMIRCYADRLSQLWTNLIHNALQAMDFAGTLTINVREEGPWAIVSIQDTGCGVPDELRTRIFEPFFTTKPAGEGTGLGLDIANNIVSKHYGRIALESEPDQGTTFTVWLSTNGEMPEEPDD